MAYVHNVHARESKISEGVAGFFKSIGDRYARYKVYRATINELAQLSDRDLADLGIHRSQVRGIAREAAYHQ